MFVYWLMVLSGFFFLFVSWIVVIMLFICLCGIMFGVVEIWLVLLVLVGFVCVYFVLSFRKGVISVDKRMKNIF